MEAEFYWLTTIWVCTVNTVLACLTAYLIKKGGASSLVTISFLLVSFAWIGFIHLVLGGELLFPENFSNLAFYCLILGFVASVFALFGLFLRKYFFALSQSDIQIFHGVRVFVGAGFLMEAVFVVIPSWFGIMDGFLHVTSGFLALVAAIFYVQSHHLGKRLLWLANIVGIADVLIIATSICFWVWDDLGPNHNMMYVVFYVAPILLWLHFVSIRSLLGEPKNTAS